MISYANLVKIVELVYFLSFIDLLKGKIAYMGENSPLYSSN